MAAPRLEVRDVDPEALIAARRAAAPTALPPATAVSVDQAAGLDLRATLAAALLEMAELAGADDKARVALGLARTDAETARSVLERFADLDETIAKYLAGLARSGQGGAGRSALPAHMQEARKAEHLAAVDAADADRVVQLLAVDAAAAATALDRARVAANNLVDTIAGIEVQKVVDAVHATEREAGRLRMLAVAVSAGRSIGSPVAVPWAVTQLHHDVHHAQMIDLVENNVSAAAAAAERWAAFRVALLADPAAVFDAGPAA